MPYYSFDSTSWCTAICADKVPLKAYTFIQELLRIVRVRTHYANRHRAIWHDEDWHSLFRGRAEIHHRHDQSHVSVFRGRAMNPHANRHAFQKDVPWEMS